MRGPAPRNERTASVFSELLYVTGRVLLFCIKAFLLLIGAVLGLVVLGLVVGSSPCWSGERP